MNCEGPDLEGTCRRCGVKGDLEKSCDAGHDRCVACERAGFSRSSHRTGSAGCAARRAALLNIGELTYASQNDRGTPDPATKVWSDDEFGQTDGRGNEYRRDAHQRAAEGPN